MYLYNFILSLAMILSVLIDFTFFLLQIQSVLYDFVFFFMIELVNVSMVWLTCWKIRIYIISAWFSLLIVLPSWSHDLTRTYHYLCDLGPLYVIVLQVASRAFSITFCCVIISKIGYTYVFVFVFWLDLFAFILESSGVFFLFHLHVSIAHSFRNLSSTNTRIRFFNCGGA